MPPLVSVVVRAWNRAHLIRDTLESIIAQTERDLEILVVDDGSTDGTEGIVEEAARIDARVRLLRQDHRGPAAALNTGVRAARGSYVAFLDSDDLWAPECVARRVEALRADPSLGAVLVDWESFGEGSAGRPSPRELLERTSGDLLVPLFRINFFSLCAAMLPSTALAEAGPVDESLGAAEDYDLGLRVALKRPIVFLPDRLVRVRSHANHIMADPTAYRFRCAVLERFAADHADRLPRAVVRDRLAEVNRMVGDAYLLARDVARARWYFGRSLRYRPWQTGVWRRLLRSLLGPPIARTGGAG